MFIIRKGFDNFIYVKNSNFKHTPLKPLSFMPTSSNPFSLYSAKIKDVYIELKNYEFFHSPYHDEIADRRFIGRRAVIRRIKTMLRQSKTMSGTYLVTGFRGMGKTSVVREAIHEYNRDLGDTTQNAHRLFIWSFVSIMALIVMMFPVIFIISSKVDWPIIGNTYFPFFVLVLFLSAFCEVILTLGLLETKEGSGLTSLTWYLQPLLLILLFLTILGLGTQSLNDFPSDLVALPFDDDALFTFLLKALKILVLIYCSVTFFLGLYDTLKYFFIKCIRLIEEYFVYHGKIKKRKRYHSFEINLSQEDLKEIDILKRITKEVLDYWSEYWEKEVVRFNRPIYFVWRFLIGIVLSKRTRLSLNQRYKSILAKLEGLNWRINAQVTAQNEMNVSPNLSLGVSNGFARLALPLGSLAAKESLRYPIASAKEIEDELIGIFKSIYEYRESKQTGLVPDFIFIIDELDKIEPHVSPNLQEKESANPTLDDNMNAPGSSKIRKRQEAVSRLLGNLKGFLNVVRAKFFFIGGREMFDASLADIADRDSFYSSIFNDVIYIDSFFKDKVENRAGVTQMTESYLCKLILEDLRKVKGDDEHDEGYRLKRLASLLSKNGDKVFIEDDRTKINPFESLEYAAQLHKLFFLLQNYIIYLTYRSNGTPKKLSTLIESIIVPYNQDWEKTGDVFLVEHKSNRGRENRLFLRFKFNFQYEIGLTADVYRPYIISNSRHIKSLGDKLLFSSAFIMDHILKYHAFGFSWRNLELIPEVILVNKEPNLRQFIEEIIDFLSKTHIRSTVSGIYQYRFNAHISRELTYLSKTSDLGAAAFNFTLDESLQIKRHYKRKLIELRNKYQGFMPIKGDNQFVHSLCFVQTILGDLYFYDKEYDEAIIYYSESIQSLRLPEGIKYSQITRHQLFLWLRNKLKLGLTLEKMRAYNSAFSNYRNLIHELEIALKHVLSANNNPSNKGKDGTKDEDLAIGGYETLQLISMPFVAYLSVIEKMRSDGITFMDLKNQRLELERIIPKLSLEACKQSDSSTYDKYRIHLLWADYYNNTGSLLFHKNCHFSWLYKEKEFHRGLICEGILKQIEKSYLRVGSKKDFQPSLSGLTYYMFSVHHLVCYHEERLRLVVSNKDKPPGIDYSSFENTSSFSLLPAYLFNESLDFINANRFYYLANIIAKLGDAILSSLDSLELASSEPIKLFQLRSDDNKKSIFCLMEKMKKRENKDFFSFESAIDLYELAAAFYLRAGQINQYVLQYKKILYVLKDLVSQYRLNQEDQRSINLFSALSVIKLNVKSANKDKIKKENVSFSFLEKIAEGIIKGNSWNYEVSGRPQVLKYRSTLGLPDEDKGRSMLYNIMNNSADAREAIIIVEEIKLKLSYLIEGNNSFQNCSDSNFPYLTKELRLNNLFISPYSSINNRFCRILELKFRCEWYFFILNNILTFRSIVDFSIEKEESAFLNSFTNGFEAGEVGKTIKKWFKNSEVLLQGSRVKDLLIYLISESIFCLREIIKMTSLYEPGYVIGYSYLAEAHRKLGGWCQAYVNFKKLFIENDRKDVADRIDKRIGDLVGINALMYLEPNYHYELAIQNYYRTIQMHVEGREYKKNILNFYVLEDDYNDSLVHFSLSMERLRVNTDEIRRKIIGLKGKIEGKIEDKIEDEKDRESETRFYKYSSYYPVGYFESDDNNKDLSDNKKLKEIFDFLMLPIG